MGLETRSSPPKTSTTPRGMPGVNGRGNRSEMKHRETTLEEPLSLYSTLGVTEGEFCLVCDLGEQELTNQVAQPKTDFVVKAKGKNARAIWPFSAVHRGFIAVDERPFGMAHRTARIDPRYRPLRLRGGLVAQWGAVWGTRGIDTPLPL